MLFFCYNPTGLSRSTNQVFPCVADPAVGIFEESADVWSAWRNCLLAKRKKEKSSAGSQVFFFLFVVLEGMQGGTLEC